MDGYSVQSSEIYRSGNCGGALGVTLGVGEKAVHSAAHAPRKGLSQEDLAYAAGVNRSYMSTLEREASYPGLETIGKLAAEEG